ncbi:MAG TPA: lipoyl synthase [Polyangiales bacterium]|nr:lipoyl synthase [Polyangiales bacterium]
MGLHERKPEWLKVRMPGGERHAELTQTFRRLQLHTVCEEARCPNIGECWREGTATIMILGDVCTRGCRFCAVTSGNPGGKVDENEPAHVANALAQMDLAYVVLTMVDRDDLKDGGASHVARTVSSIHARSPELLVETLVGDFAGNKDLIATVVQNGQPDVYAHNVEVVPSLQRKMRDARCSWQRSLETLMAAREAGANVTKTSLMVGCGETADEVEAALHELRAAHIDVLTIGQYLRPTPKHAPVVRYVEPAEFDHYKEVGQALGFQYIASGPLVRSSYRAAEAFLKGKLRGERVRYSDRYGKRRLEVVS